ncbi:MAG: hypothetical protein AAFU50_01720, partial [Pseudomonadota bacterium]
MSHFVGARTAASFAIGAAAVALVYELRAQGISVGAIPDLLAALIAFVVVSRLAAWAFDWTARLPLIRRLVGGRSFVEGHWHLRGKMFGADAKPLEQAGIMTIQHDALRGEVRVVTSRLGMDGELFTSTSEIAHVQRGEVETRLISYFKFAYPGPETRFGMITGVFSNPDLTTAPPTVLETHTAVSGDGRMVRQQATRIDARMRRRWRRQFGNFWIEQYLAHDGVLEKVQIGAERDGDVDESALKEIGHDDADGRRDGSLD